MAQTRYIRNSGEGGTDEIPISGTGERVAQTIYIRNRGEGGTDEMY